MKKKTSSLLIYMLMITLVVVMVVVLLLFRENIGLPVNITNNFAMLLAGAAISVVGIFVVIGSAGLYSILGMPIMGLGIARLLNDMYALNYITDMMLSGLIITDLYMWCIILGLLFGAIISALKVSMK